MRIYLENVGEQGFAANEGAAIGPRKDGGIVMHLTRDDLDRLRELDTENGLATGQGILVRFDHPDYDASLVPDRSTVRSFVRLFNSLKDRAEKHLKGRGHVASVVRS